MRSVNIDDDILMILSKLNRPASTEEIAREIDKEWHTVHKYCHILKSKGKIHGFRVGRMNLWVIGEGVGEE